MAQLLFQNARLLDVEAGAGYAADGLSLRANVFWMEFTDELVKSGQVDIFGQPVTGNAERSRHAGIEVEASARRGGLLLSGNMTFSRNRVFGGNRDPEIISRMLSERFSHLGQKQ